ncbi:CTP synthase [Patescibacteria group bacterium]
MHPQKNRLKYIFISGGVISGIGKGISTASIALLLKSSGYKVSVIKVDMYLNIDAGTINPLEHGEVFVTEDGLETDQDLGNYERFLNQDLYRHNYMTMGQIYFDVITKERKLEYGGEDVEGHVHIPKEIIRRINETAKKDKAEIVLIEVGGTVGEYQNVMFFEAIRRLKQQKPNDVSLIHLVYLLFPAHLGELKTKPAQNSIYDLYKLGLQADYVIARSEVGIDNKKRGLIAHNAGMDAEHIISAPDIDTVYKIPLLFQEQKLDKKILKTLSLKKRETPLKKWKPVVDAIDKSNGSIKIAVVGKYFKIGKKSVLEDAYICVIEAIKHAGWNLGINPSIQWFDVERFEKKSEEEEILNELKQYDAIIVPQGWGSRGVEGKIKTVQFARENKIPYLGLCFGMQMAVIEYSRNVLKLKDANSTEANKRTKNPVIHIMPEQKKLLKKNQYGGTIRLGSWPCKLKKGSKLEKLYKEYGPELIKAGKVQERHRHRYEVNNKYKNVLEKNGMIISGTSPDGKLCEAVELSKKVHPYFIATQYHPEYKSRLMQPHPLFIGLLKAACDLKEKKKDRL